MRQKTDLRSSSRRAHDSAARVTEGTAALRRREKMGLCFPATVERAATSREGWAAARQLTRAQAEALAARLQACGAAPDLQLCHQIALNLDLPYPQARSLP